MIGIVNCGTSFLDAIKNQLKELGYPWEEIYFKETANYDFEAFSGIIITGSPTHLTQIYMQNYMELFKFVKTVSTPILGICFGHQILGVLYGSEVANMGKMIDTIEEIEIVKDDVLFSKIKNQSLFREKHSEFITLPEGFHLLAKSKSCENEAMKHQNKAIYGVQFHPEVSDEDGRQLLKNFLNICSTV